MASQTPLERGLRITAIVSFVPALALLLANSIITLQRPIGLCLIPMGVSGIFNIIVLFAMPKKQKSGSQVVFFVVDTLLACFLMVMLVPVWQDLVSNKLAYSRTWALGYNRYRLVILGTYGTVTVLTNFTIHIFLALRQLYYLDASVWSRLKLSRSSCPSCPHCQQHPAASAFGAAVDELYTDSPTATAPRRSSVAKEPRESTDDETARLV